MSGSRKPSLPVRLRVEALELRTVPAVIGIDAEGDLLIDLRKDGRSNDTVQVRDAGSYWRVDLNGGTPRYFSKGAVGPYIECYCGQGNDVFQNFTRLIADVQGGDGNDRLYGGPDGDDLDGGAGDDFISAGPGHDYVVGGTGNDTIYGGSGYDTLEGYTGHDLIYGGSDPDTLYGSHGNDSLFGEGGADALYGEGGNDKLDGGADGDYVHGGTENDELSGGSGDDTLEGYTGHDVLAGGYGNDVLYGSLGNDHLYGEEGSDWLYGEGGNDTYFYYYETSGSDRIGDVGGTDTLDFSRMTTGFTLDLASTTGQTLMAGLDLTLADGGSIENLIGGSGDDILIGNGLKNVIRGGGGNDLLSGRGGDDTLHGEGGNDGLFGGMGGRDTLVGGPGNDRLLDDFNPFAYPNRESGDALIRLSNEGEKWADREVEQIDVALAQLQAKVNGSTWVLKDTLTGDPLTFVKKSPKDAVYDGKAYSGLNSVWWRPFGFERRIYIQDWNEFNTGETRSRQGTVIHEIGHNWDATDFLVATEDNPLWTAFKALHRQSDSRPGSPDFASDYGQTGVEDDWCEVWKMVFGYPAVGRPAKPSAVLLEKVALVEEFFALRR